ncbi:sigma-70 family RNA polymerase sigma factor [Mesobacillus maritimus]|uniref:Sigma-70 family RNA polymerase sigma factor n=1 Tax=Mesobacillus maritimus TaxID=1643336 RepID=A0ABS7K590_9BACI|nr:sigma-70 family RNA polymerase sigma factor [Mesobacillus maritimus]
MAVILERIHKAQNGDDEAFLELFQKYEQDLYRMAFVYVKNQDDALDVLQETAYKAFKNIETLREPRYLKTWLIKIAISCATDLIRKRKNVVYLNQTDMELASKDSTDVTMTITMQQILETLDELEKSIVFLKYYSELTFKEIAELKDLPLGTVKTTLYRALAKLRVEMKGADLL